MTFDACMEFLDGRINYERRGMPTRAELRLDRIRSLLQELGDPHRRYRVIHVAGTKGKGSTALMLAAFLESAGRRVGLHTSPHFHWIGERFRVNGRDASPEELAGLAERVAPLVAKIDRRLCDEQPELTFFEITTAMAFEHFARMGVDWAVVEVGMGGRLDATNVVQPEVAVITSIGRDHTRQLGDSIAAIAREKAGIIKPSAPVVSGATQEDARNCIAEVAASTGSPLRQIGDDFRVELSRLNAEGTLCRIRTWRREWPELQIPFFGHHQAANAAVASAAMDALADLGVELKFDAAKAIRAIRLPARIEVFNGPVSVVVDAAHNEPSSQSLVETLAELQSGGVLPGGPATLVFAASRDKHWKEMLDILAPSFASMAVTEFHGNPRAVPVDELIRGEWRRAELKELCAFQDPHLALQWAIDRQHQRRTALGKTGFVCVAGSLFLASELRDAVIRSTQI